ncbi:O-acetyltransferase OatA [Frondihabitans sp. 762G35]|uniref:acyltransferase family protein n=1 Tax=Frondihabitans sp. 762G35 TaxID=1446794 RepID=UPI000D1FFFAC|nr:acyltransferase family protein [Frondihabitans sp. 762G35]ARC56927.1 O-acetyltransferase OatA [Frondihabitans sp. 762G35]
MSSRQTVREGSAGATRLKALTMQTPDRPARKPSPEAHRQRADIQGLRTLAVVAVILNHLLAWPSGGFVGVDVFFVVSGFLITGLLLREHDRTGRISFAGFYRRRARRILPIATLVLVATVAASFAIFLPARARTISVDAIWSFVFAGNWHFALVGTDYFASDGTTSPLQHYWSLGVEEQFYLVWPWILVLVFAVAAKRRWSGRHGRGVLAAILLALTVASFAWGVAQSVSDPGFAYFSTGVRAWELGVGALLALGVPLLERIPGALRPVLGWLGLSGLVAAVFATSGSSGFPAPGAAGAVLATAFVVAAGTGGPSHVVVLANPVSSYLGDVSYSLYLWHFPVIILLGAVVPMSGFTIAACLLLTLGLSVASYHLIEDPIRKSTWLDRRAREARRLESGARRPRRVPVIFQDVDRPDLAVMAGAVVVAIVAVAYFAQTAPRPAEPQAQAAESVTTVLPGATPSSSDTGSPAEQALSARISAALTATSFPELDPSVDSLGTSNWVKAAAASGCADITPATEERCQSGPVLATKQVAVLGDSFAIAWLPGLRAALAEAGYRVHTYTYGQCPAASVTVRKEGGAPFPECASHRTWAIGRITALKPDLVILADSSDTIDRLATKKSQADGSAEIAAGLGTTVRAIAPSAKRVVYLSDPPVGVALQQCVTRFAKPSDCARSTTSTWEAIQAADRQAVEAAGGTYLSTVRWFCDTRGRCPAFVGTTPVRADAGHLTVQYSTALEPLLAAALKL